MHGSTVGLYGDYARVHDGDQMGCIGIMQGWLRIYRGIMENQLEQQIEKDMETGVRGFRISRA